LHNHILPFLWFRQSKNDKHTFTDTRRAAVAPQKGRFCLCAFGDVVQQFEPVNKG
jgi:hypothetical protein